MAPMTSLEKHKNKIVVTFSFQYFGRWLMHMVRQMHQRISVYTCACNNLHILKLWRRKSGNTKPLVLVSYILGIFWMSLYFEHQSSLRTGIHLLVGIRTVAVYAKCSTDKNEASNPTFFLYGFSGVAFIVLKTARKKPTSLCYVC